MGKYGKRIRLAAKAHGRDWRETLAITVAESCGDENAVSFSGAVGLMQLMPKTARYMGIKDPFNPQDNLWAGTKYLKYLEEKKGFTEPAERFLAYNEGPDGAEEWLRVNKDPKTHNYVASVLHVLSIIRKTYPDSV